MQQAQKDPTPAQAPAPTTNGKGAVAGKIGALAILAVAGIGTGYLFAITNWPALFRGLSGFQAVMLPWSPTRWTIINLWHGLVGWIALIGTGYWMLGWRPWRRMLPAPLERLVFAPLAGGVALSLAMFGATLISASRDGMGAMFLAGLGAGLVGLQILRRDFRNRQLARLDPKPPVEPLLWAAGIALACIAPLALLYALAPAAESDELRYHFAALFEWKRDGRMHYLPHQAFSNFPMLGEMLFLYAMPSDSALQTGAGKLMHLIFLPAAIGQIALLTRDLIPARSRRGSRAIPLVSGLLFAFIPCVPVLAGWGFVDLFVVAYFLGFVLLAGRALRRPSRASGSLLGLIAGGTIAVKYSMLPLLGLLGVIWFLLMLLAPASRKRAARLAAATALGTILFGGAWYLRNAIWTGNPFYPLAWSIFHGGDWSSDNAAFYASKAAEKGFFAMQRLAETAPAWANGASGKLLEFLMTPVTTLLQFDRFESHPIGFLPLLFLLLALGGWALKPSGRIPSRSGAFWVALAALVSWAFWFMTYQSNRMLLPTLALLLALGGASLPRWRNAWPKLFIVVRFLLAAGMLYGMAFYLYILGSQDGLGRSKADAIAVAAGIQDPDNYLRRHLNYFSAAQWLNAQSKETGEGALLIGEHRTLYFTGPLVASDWFDTPQPLPLIRETRDNDALLDKLLADHIGYIFLNEQELKQYRDLYFRPRFRPEEYARYEALLKSPRLQLIKRFAFENLDIEDVRLYRILPNGASSVPVHP